MRRILIWAAIDIAGGDCVRLYQGDFQQRSVYGDDPAAMAVRWVDAGADGLHVIDLDGAEQGRSVNWRKIEQIRRTVTVTVPVQAGGGFRTLAAVRTAASAGVRPIVSTRALGDAGFLAAAVQAAPDVVLAVDVGCGQVRAAGWKQAAALSIDEAVGRARSAGVRRLLVSDVTRDGTLGGVNVELMKTVAGLGVEVIAAGGVTDEEDVQAVAAVPGVVGCVIGKALYEGKITIQTAKKVSADGMR